MKGLPQIKFLLIILSIVGLFFVFRLPNLTSQPIFADEAIYIRWSQVMKSEATLRFLPLQDGKTPLYMWTLMPIFKLVENPLLAGRLLSVISGLGTLAGVFFLGYWFFNLETALWASFILAITPFFVFFDRMALVDAMLAAFSIWVLNLSLLVVKKLRTDLAMVLGYLIGGSILVKTPGLFNLVTLPTALLAFNWQPKNRTNRLIKLALLWMLAIVISMVIFNILRLGPGFNNLNSRDNDYILPFSRLWTNPLDPFIPHLGVFADWLIKLIGVPTVILIFGGIFLLLKQKNKIGLALLFWSIIPTLAYLLLLRTFTARYLLFPIIPWTILAGICAQFLTSRLRNRFIGPGLIIILLIWPVYFNYQLLFNIEKTPLPLSERTGYLEEWTAGYGLPQIAQYLEQQAASQKIVVGTEGSFGTLPDGLQIYFDKNPNVSFVPGGASVSAGLRQAAKDHPTFFVANESRVSENTAGLKLLQKYSKAHSSDPTRADDAMLLFAVLKP